MGCKNLTIKGKTDGFGCQWNARLSGMAFCYSSEGLFRYVHTPFSNVGHCWRGESEIRAINEFVGVPDNRGEAVVDVVQKYNSKVFRNPNAYYKNYVLDKIRHHYWSTAKPEPSDCEIAVHIRRGDVHPSRGGDRKSRYIPNVWYNHYIPRIAKKYPSDFRIAIYSEGAFEDFVSVIDGWPKDLIGRTVLRIANPSLSFQDFDMLTTYHHLVTAKVLVMAKSGLSYAAAILSEGDVFFMKSKMIGQNHPLSHWIKNWQKSI